MKKAHPIPDGRLLSIEQAALFLSCSKGTIYNLRKRGKLDIVKLGHSSKVPEASLRRLIEELPRQRMVK